MSSEQATFMKSTQSALNALHSLYTTTAQSMYAYSMGDIQAANQMALQCAIYAERLTTRYRAIPLLYGSPNAKKQVEQIIQQEIPVEIGFTKEGWFSLRTPRLLPRKERTKKNETGTNEYFRGFLYPALQRFFRNEFPVRYGECVLILRHVYNQSEPERSYRDHDNIEVNFLVDVIAEFVLPDDAPLKCRHYYCSAKGPSERTEVYVVPEDAFMNWYEAEKTFPQEGVKLNVQTTFWPEKVIPKQGKIHAETNIHTEKAKKPLQL